MRNVSFHVSEKTPVGAPWWIWNGDAVGAAIWAHSESERRVLEDQMMESPREFAIRLAEARHGQRSVAELVVGEFSLSPEAVADASEREWERLVMDAKWGRRMAAKKENRKDRR